MKVRSLALLFILASLGCRRHQGWLELQDPSIRMPSYETIMAGSPIDGLTLRALQVAAEDFFPSQGAPRACIDTREAHRFYAVRSGEVIYVAILQDPAHCGRAYPSLDAGARYAISVDGRILRRLLAGEPELAVGQDTSKEDGPEPSALDADGGTEPIDVSIPQAGPVHFPGLADAGTPSPDAGAPR
ncbi:hypothetical protein HPC49_14820 [Pyxidicoccus fallax]|uniref:Lipoprotein n=1 Tax=Pyxidicoccus fallax TaxID=394095 RepID=A0A848LJY2_9BACT|nr:hypothetical protein [Pyxidicoccus fallax]NMO18008.1 hypothetical protein [Pyxidicoccus fallax]NPC79505.1 hypothetical protein [Pyxidicoccus fallax]